MGNRKKRLEQARAALARLPGCRLRAASRIYETAPVGPSRRPFLNMAARLGTSLSPMGLLVELKRLETLAGRKPGPRWGPRPLDIDILDYGGLRLASPWLTLPHPAAAARAFALAPLAEIAPRRRLDGKRTVLELLRRLNPRPETAKILANGR
ncbi:MAG: 2-amino-4-hydroxy-6-hydroxymethyldihydropteridine diphosphokinase [Elusimicrobia bacterium]|nr:2-amino-4-hydroxy-6-hydroxymethyldihydropteridine diphosphokinase [Elusimicrobiota bacterium]